MAKAIHYFLWSITVVALLVTSCGGPATLASTTPLPLGGEATVSEVVNVVEARASTHDAFAPIVNQSTLHEGSQIRTGDASGARLDLTGGTVVRVGPNSSLAISYIIVSENDTRIDFQLEAGKIWLNAIGGKLKVTLPVGTVSMRGAYGVIEYDPAADVLTLDCIAGSCQVANSTVDEELGNQERIVLTQGGQQFTKDRLDIEAVRSFVNQNPEQGQSVVETLIAVPNPTVITDTPSPIIPSPTTAPTDTPSPIPTRTFPPTKVATATFPLPTRTRIPTPTPTICITHRIGAICRDGWHSPATGRGACSHHRGVDHWLYNYCP